MDKQKIKQHIEKIKFKLKDLNRTTEKYKSYKPLFVQNFFKENESDILNHLENLEDLIKEKIQEKEQYGVFNFLYEGEINKSKINRFKTWINSLTYELNNSFIKYQENLKKNEIKVLTIILYLKFYEEINKKMYNVFKEFILNLPSYKCIHGLKD